MLLLSEGRGEGGEGTPRAAGDPGPEPTCQQSCLMACPPPRGLSQQAAALFSPQAAALEIPVMRKVPRGGKCRSLLGQPGEPCQGTRVMIVIHVDTAGNGRAGASSKCTEAGNEPRRFF